MVMSEKRTRTNVAQYVVTMSSPNTPITNPATMAATKIPLPVADSQFSLKIASSGFADGGATGGVRCTTLCRCDTSNFGAETLSSCCFTRGQPQMKTNTLSKI